MALCMLRVPTTSMLEVLARVEMKGVPLHGLKSVAGVTTIVLDGCHATGPFESSLRSILTTAHGQYVRGASVAELLESSTFSPQELLVSDNVGGSAVTPAIACGDLTPAHQTSPPSAERDHLQDGEEDPTTHKSLLRLLDDKGVAYETSTHAAVRTSEQAAEIRGATLASGAKAMLLSVKPSNEFVLAVISASERMDSKLMRKAGGFKASRFASEEEVMQITGCVPGAVPPFGSLWGLKTFMDDSLQEQGAEINFNAGLKTHSVKMTITDYLRAEKPVICQFRA
ncbi:hypothetical protein AB1Y20_010567 [Prymnesium parvum]|uniref:YbaK/aminoacyl-tRNA synthetase-associated domain-containing protein n=1 Tax=Prymnesium parvum TaxID=97485 RepID=A0AB34ISL4_PRYPA